MNIFHSPALGSIIITKPLPRRLLEPFDRLNYDFSSTILDPQLDTQPGYIPIRNNIRYYDTYAIRPLLGYDISPWTTSDRVVSLLESKSIDPKQYMHTTSNNYLMVPPGINRQYITDSGVAVLDPMQRAANDLVEYYIQYRNTVIMNMRYQILITTYIDSISKLLLSKGGLFDKLTGCIHPCSGRAVVSCNPTLPVDVVGIPAKMVNRWLHNEEFRSIYNLPDNDLKVAYHTLKNRLVMVMRQPIHNRGSIVSMKLHIVNGSVIQINPILIAGIFQGDHDGDQMAVFMPVIKSGIDSLPNMYIGNLLGDKFSKICKEIRFSQPNDMVEADEYLPNDVSLANVRSRELFESTTDGYSISYKDLVGDPNSRFNHILSSEQQDTLHDIANGLTLEEIYNAAEEDLNGLRSTGSAIEGYRVIKGSTAKVHGAMNSAIALAFALYGGQYGNDNSNNSNNSSGDSITSTNRTNDTYSNHQVGISDAPSPTRSNGGISRHNQVRYTTNPDFIRTIRDLATIKRLLAGAGLSSKHGGECRATDNRAMKIQELFYYPTRSGWSTREQAYKFLTEECKLPCVETNTLLDVIWTEPPSNINDRLRKLCPGYMMTRRGATLDLIDNWVDNVVNGREDNSLTQYFYNTKE